MRQRELQRRRGQRHLVRVAHRIDRGHPRDDVWRRRDVVPCLAPRQDAGVQRSAHHDRCAVRVAHRQQVVERALLQQVGGLWLPDLPGPAGASAMPAVSYLLGHDPQYNA